MNDQELINSFFDKFGDAFANLVAVKMLEIDKPKELWICMNKAVKSGRYGGRRNIEKLAFHSHKVRTKYDAKGKLLYSVEDLEKYKLKSEKDTIKLGR